MSDQDQKKSLKTPFSQYVGGHSTSALLGRSSFSGPAPLPPNRHSMLRRSNSKPELERKRTKHKKSSSMYDDSSTQQLNASNEIFNSFEKSRENPDQIENNSQHEEMKTQFDLQQSPRQQRNMDKINCMRSDAVFSFQNRVLTESDRHLSMPNNDSTDQNQIERLMREVNLITSRTDGNKTDSHERNVTDFTGGHQQLHEQPNVQTFNAPINVAPQLGTIQEEANENYNAFQSHSNSRIHLQQSAPQSNTGIQSLGNQVVGFDKLIPQQSPEQQTTNQSKNSSDQPRMQDGIGRHLIEGGGTPPGQPNSQEYMIIFQTLLNRALRVQHLGMQVFQRPLKEELSPEDTRSFRDLCSKLLSQYEHALQELQQARQCEQSGLLQSMIDQVRTNQQQLSQDNSQKEQLIGSLKSELLFVKGQLQFQKSQILKRDQEKNELLAMMQQSANEKHQMNQAMRDMQRQIEDQVSAANMLCDMKKQLESKETEQQSLQQMYNGSRKENGELEERIKNLKSELDKLQEEYRDGMESLEKKHKQELAKAKDATSQLKIDLEKARENQANAKERSDVLAAELKRQVEDMSKRLETVQNQKHETSQELRLAQSKLSDVLQQFSSTKEELGQLRVRQLEHRTQVESQRGNESKLAQQLLAAREENEYLRGALESSERRLQQGLDRVELQVAFFNKHSDQQRLDHCGVNSIGQAVAQAKLIEQIVLKSKENDKKFTVTTEDYQSLKDELDQVLRRVAQIEQEKAGLEQLIVEIMQFGEECEMKEQAINDKLRNFEQLADVRLTEQESQAGSLQVLLSSHQLCSQLDSFRRKNKIEETIKEVFDCASEKIKSQADDLEQLQGQLNQKSKELEDQKSQRDLVQQQLDEVNLQYSDMRNLISQCDQLTKKVLMNIEEHENFLQRSASKRDRSPHNISMHQQFRTFDKVCQTLLKDLSFIYEWSHDQVLVACNFLKDREKVVKLNLKVNELQKVNSLVQIEADKQRLLNQRYSQMMTSQTSPDVAMQKRVSRTARQSVVQPELHSLLSKVQTLRSEAAELPSSSQEVRDGSRKVRNVREVLRELEAGVGQETGQKSEIVGSNRDLSAGQYHTALDQKGSFDLKHYDQRAKRKRIRKLSADSQNASSSHRHDSSLSQPRRIQRSITPNELDDRRTSFGNTMLEEQLNSYRQIEQPKFNILDSRRQLNRKVSQDFQQTSAFLQPPVPHMDSFAGHTRGMQTLEVPQENRFQTLQMYPQHDEQQSNSYISNMMPTGAYTTMDAFNDSTMQNFPIIIEEHRGEATGSHDMDRYLQNPEQHEPSKTETEAQDDMNDEGASDRDETEDQNSENNLPLQMNQHQEWEQQADSFEQMPLQQEDIFQSYQPPSQHQTIDSLNHHIQLMSYQGRNGNQNRQSEYVSLNPQSIGDTFQESSMGTVQNAPASWQGIGGVHAPANTSVQNTPSGGMGKHLAVMSNNGASRATSEMVSHYKQQPATSQQKMSHIAQLLKDQQRLMEKMAMARQQTRPHTAHGTLENTKSLSGCDDRDMRSQKQLPVAIFQKSEPVTHRPPHDRSFEESKLAANRSQHVLHQQAQQQVQRQMIPRPKSQQQMPKKLKSRFLHPTSQSRDAFSSQSDQNSTAVVPDQIDDRMYVTRDQQNFQRRGSCSEFHDQQHPMIMHQKRQRQYESQYFPHKYTGGLN